MAGHENLNENKSLERLISEPRSTILSRDGVDSDVQLVEENVPEDSISSSKNLASFLIFFFFNFYGRAVKLSNRYV